MKEVMAFLAGEAIAVALDACADEDAVGATLHRARVRGGEGWLGQSCGREHPVSGVGLLEGLGVVDVVLVGAMKARRWVDGLFRHCE